MGYVVRPMRAEDIPQVMQIEREAFPTEWPPPSFKRDLNNRLTHYLVALEESGSPCQTKVEQEGNLPRLVSKIRRLLNKGHRFSEGTVTQTKENIVGYASMWLMMDEAHLTSIAVRQSHRRQGIGELLLVSIINLATQLNAQVLTLEVRLSNLAAQALYEKYGFTKRGVRRGYYSDNGEDAVIMSTEKITSASYQAKFQELKRGYIQRWGLIKTETTKSER